MPRVRVVDPFGTPYSIDTSDPEVLAGWLLEITRLMVTNNCTMGWRIDPVYPNHVWDDGKQNLVPDWPVSGQDGMWLLNRDQMQRLHAAIDDVKNHRTVGFTRSGRLLVEQETQKQMSEARWCDYRDHPYKGGREGTIMMGQTVRMPNGGLQQTGQDVREICPECAAELGLNPDYEAPEPPAVRRELVAKAAGKDKTSR